MVVFDFAYAREILPQLAAAFLVNIEATLLAFALAAVAGLLLELLRRSRMSAVRTAAEAFVEFVRSTPLLVQLFLLYYVLPNYGIRLEALTTGVLALGLHYACYLAEVYRAGIDAVSRGQWDAAVALNMPRREIWRRIILPQAVPPVVPMLANYFIAMIKDTPLLAAISVAEAMQRATVLGARTYQYLEPVTIVGLLMLAASLVLAGLAQLLETAIRNRPGAFDVAHR